MAEATREEAQQRRAEGRERRRSMLTEPFEQASDAAEGSGGTIEIRDTIKRAALSAAPISDFRFPRLRTKRRRRAPTNAWLQGKCHG